MFLTVALFLTAIFCFGECLISPKPRISPWIWIAFLAIGFMVWIATFALMSYVPLPGSAGFIRGLSDSEYWTALIFGIHLSLVASLPVIGGIIGRVMRRVSSGRREGDPPNALIASMTIISLITMISILVSISVFYWSASLFYVLALVYMSMDTREVDPAEEFI
jgi:hypothetical protein